MDLKEFLQQTKQCRKFQNVRLSKSPEFSNCVLASGDIVGQDSMENLIRLGRSYSVEVISDHITVWESEEFFRKYGNLVNGETKGGGITNIIPLP